MVAIIFSPTVDKLDRYIKDRYIDKWLDRKQQKSVLPFIVLEAYKCKYKMLNV